MVRGGSWNNNQENARCANRNRNDPNTRHLVNLIIDTAASVPHQGYSMTYFPGDDLLAICRPRGLPIGNLTSQIWANCYLSPLDHFIKRELMCRGYVRFVDDLILFADDKRTLWSWKRALEARLASLRLEIHPGAHPRPVTEGISFLGFIVFPDRRRLKSRKATHFARRIRARLAAAEGNANPDEGIDAAVRGWMAHASYGNTVGLRRSVLARLGLRWEDFVE